MRDIVTFGELEKHVDFLNRHDMVKMSEIFEIMKANMNPVIEMDRSEKLVYPMKWKHKLLHPRIHDAGPPHVNVRALEFHHITGQGSASWMSGKTIHDYYSNRRMLRYGLGFREFQLIRDRGTKFFARYIYPFVITAPKSAVIDEGGDIYIPFMCLRSDQKGIVLDWCWIGNGHFHVTTHFPCYGK